VVNQRSRFQFSSNALFKLQLPLEWHIQFKLTTLTFKTLHTGRPPYLTASLAASSAYTISLRSSSSDQLFYSAIGSRAFRFSAARIWNSLSLRIRESQSLPAFKRHLKTHFPSIIPYPPTRPDFIINCGATRLLLTYLLTYVLTYTSEKGRYGRPGPLWIRACLTLIFNPALRRPVCIFQPLISFLHKIRCL